MQFYGVDALIRIVMHLAFIYLAFWSLRALRLETFFQRYHVTQVRMAIMLCSIVLGYQASSFFLEFILLCKNVFLTLNN